MEQVHGEEQRLHSAADSIGGRNTLN